MTTVEFEEGITKIADKLFRSCTGLTVITIPSTVTEIGSYAFSSCTGLTTVEIPDSVTKIGSYAFDSCTVLAEVTLPSELETLEYRAFYNCTSITSINIPSSLTDTDRAFANCANLTTVEFEEGITKIADNLFRDCTGLTTLTIPATVTEIGSYAFNNCTSLTTVEIPDSVIKIEEHAFDNCTALAVVTLPSELETLEYRAFYNCTSITSINIPSSLTDTDRAFANCANLTTVEFEEGITKIADKLFRSCTGLTVITIPSTVTEIGSYAFSSCTGLTTVEIPDSVTKIGSYAFDSCTVLAEVTLPSELETLEYRAFYNCTSITSINIPSSLTDTDRAFANCANLTTVEFEEGITKIADNLFRDCTGLTTLTIPATVTEIGSYAFNSCTSLTTVEIPDSVIKIGEHAFHNCTALTSIKIRSGVTSIGSYAFSGCTGLTEVKLPGSVTTIGSYAFNNCTALTAVYIPDSVTSIGSNAFNGCEDLTAYCSSSSYALTYCTENSIPVVLTDGDWEDPVARISPSRLITAVDTEFQFSGTGSSDNAGIAAYAWEFGDGSTSSEATPVHTYSEAGSYTVTLTVADASGNSDSAYAQMTVVSLGEDSDYALAEFVVVNSASAEAIEGAVLYVSTSAEEDAEILCTLESDANGMASAILENGSYNISAIADGFMSRTVAVTVSGSDEFTIALSTTSLLIGELTSTEMSYDDIVDAGIDADAEENQQVWKFEATFSFTVGLETFEVSTVVGYKNSAGTYIPGDGGYTTLNASELSGSYTFGIFPMATEGFYIVVYGEAHWLKEMYNVELVVMNASQVESIEGCTATLDLPDGLSLAKMVGEQQSEMIEIGEIPTYDSESEEECIRTATWYVCGDVEGEYYISADVTGNWVAGSVKTPFEESFTVTEPVRVYAGSALHLYIEADDYVEHGGDYCMTFRLENVSDKSLYNLSFGITGIEEYQVLTLSYEDVTWDNVTELSATDFGDSMTRTMEEMAPGGYIEIEVSVTCWFTSVLEYAEIALDLYLKSTAPGAGALMASLINVGYYLTDVNVVTLEGSTTTIPSSVSIRETTRDNLIDVVVNTLGTEVLKELCPAYKDLQQGSVGSLLISAAGKSLGISSTMISGAKSLLALQQGETDYTFEISMDDGLGNENSISNEYLVITTGDGTQGVIDFLNGTKLKVEAGEISISAKLPGSTSFKIAVVDSAGEQTREYTFNVTIDDTVLKNKITVGEDGVSGSFRLNENTVNLSTGVTVKESQAEQLESELEVYEKNPFISFDSEVYFDLSGTTSDNNYDYSFAIENSVIVGDGSIGEDGGFCYGTATTEYVIDNGSSQISMGSTVMNYLVDAAEGLGADEFTITTTKLSAEEAAALGLSEDTYTFAVTAASGTEISEFGGEEVTVSLPYSLPGGYSSEDIAVLYVKDDGTYEVMSSDYDAESGTITFSTTHFSMYSICVLDEDGNIVLPTDEENPDSSEGDGSGTSESEDTGSSETEDSGTSGEDSSGNDGSDTSGTGGSDSSEESGTDISGSGGSGASGESGSNTSGASGADTSGSGGSDTSGTGGSDASGNTGADSSGSGAADSEGSGSEDSDAQENGGVAGSSVSVSSTVCAIIILTNQSGGIMLTWNEVAGAEGYSIYRKTTSGEFKEIETIHSAATLSYTDTSVKNKNGTVYIYKVVPFTAAETGSGTPMTTVRLKGVKLSSVKNTASKKITVKWKKTTKVTGYQIQYSTSKTFKKGNKTIKVSGAKKVSKVLSKLKKGKTYYVRIRTYKKVSGKTYYSAWSSKKKVKVVK